MTTRAFRTDTTSGLEGRPVPPGHAFITELFSGIQGEGPYVGVRQIFVRLGGCDLRCWWCDTPRSLVRRDPVRAETAPASREFEVIENPLPMTEAERLLLRLRPTDHHSVTFTGGEPLLQAEAVGALARVTHAVGGRTWLETHGARAQELRDVVDKIDVVSMDIKLPSSSGENIPLEVHAEFLAIAQRTDVFAKLVVTPDTETQEVVAAAEMVGTAGSNVPFILQPVTPFGRIKEPPSPERMLDLQARCLEVHSQTRVIPQTHKLLGQM